MKISLVVEGHGDAFATPVLLRKIAADFGYFDALEIPPAFRLSRGKIVKKDDLMRAVDLMSRKAGVGGVVLVVFDADDDCPVDLVTRLRAWLDERADLRVVLVIANREFEAWYLASAESLRGIRGLSDTAVCQADCDTIRDAKGWLGRQMPGGYSETLDQPAFAANLDFRMAMRSRSFQKFAKEYANILQVAIPV